MAFPGKTFDHLLHLGANEDTFNTARYLRKKLTKPEKTLWNELKNRKLLGLKFRRQHPLHFYIADFYCHEQRFVIEVDGGVHLPEQHKEHDENRTAELERYGIRVIRFTNDQVINSIDEVKQTIISDLYKTIPILKRQTLPLSPPPSPFSWRRRG